MNGKKKALIAVIIFFSICIIGAVGYIVFDSVSKSSSKTSYNQLASSYATGICDTTAASSSGSTQTAKVKNPINFAELQKKNRDIYAWINIPDTNINYPVCRHSTDDNFYLDHDVDKNYSFAGTIYSQFCNSRNLNDPITIMYGHNMRDGSMFADLHKFESKDFFDKHDTFYIYTPDRKLTYKIISAFVYDDRHIMNSFDFSDEKVLADFQQMLLNPRSTNRNVRSGIELDTDDKIVILSTCLNSGEGRYLLQGVMINDEPTQ